MAAAIGGGSRHKIDRLIAKYSLLQQLRQLQQCQSSLSLQQPRIKHRFQRITQRLSPCSLSPENSLSQNTRFVFTKRKAISQHFLDRSKF